MLGDQFSTGSTRVVNLEPGNRSLEPIVRSDVIMSRSRSYDVVVVGATPGGIGAAVRAAREGLSTCLVTYHDRVGGMMAGGLSVTDTQIEHTRTRAPLLNEFFRRVEEHYAETYGTGSSQHEHCREGLYFEPKVAEQVFERMLGEAGVTVHRAYHPTEASRANRMVTAVRFEPIPTRSKAGEPSFELRADAFIDGTYEGDLAAVAGVPYRLGREGRTEFGEQYAGRLFSEKGTRLFPGSSGVGDDAVQAYDYRVCLCTDPENRRLPEKPPEYDREEFLPILEDEPETSAGELRAHQLREIPCAIKSELVVPTLDEIRERGIYSLLLLRGPLPNEKRDLNTADLPGEADDYPEGDWERRKEIEDRHKHHVLGLLYFLQNDEAVPAELQAEIRQWGLPLDEFEERDGFPFQLYVREARRIEGRGTFTEHDARVAEGIERAPIHEDSIAIAEYAMDSHDCRPVRRPGSLCDGHHYLAEITVPSQVPYRTLLPKDVDNLLVPVALSATHVGFGTIRLEPTWFQIGEAAGWATVLAAERGTEPDAIDTDRLQRRIIDYDGMITYFDDADPDAEAHGSHAAQYFGTKGLFASYEAALPQPLTADIATTWIDWVAGAEVEGDATALARELPSAEEGEPVTRLTFESMLSEAGVDASSRKVCVAALEACDLEPDDPMTRGEGLAGLYAVADHSS